MDNKLKIFLSYHKKTPIYKSDIFEPIQVGSDLTTLDIDILKDNTGDNISKLNPYYCELTGYYWILKNYINLTETEYIGFAHYRRLPDLLHISDEDSPSIYGISYSQSLDLIRKIEGVNVENLIKGYDVICPCSCYMYENTVNPLLKDELTHYNVYNHFKIEHNSDLLDVLRNVIEDNYPKYQKAMEECLNSEKSLFYNIFIMKTGLLKSFLEWEFDILDKVGINIGGWNQDKYKRMAGFAGEFLINVWLRYNSNLKIGYVPLYMVDFEVDYFNKSMEYREKGQYKEELSELEKLLDITENKFGVSLYLAELYLTINDVANAEEKIRYIESFIDDANEFYELAYFCEKNGLLNKNSVVHYYKEAIMLDPDNILFAKSFLLYAESTRDIDLVFEGWNYMKRFDLSEKDIERFKDFMRIYKKVKADY